MSKLKADKKDDALSWTSESLFKTSELQNAILGSSLSIRESVTNQIDSYMELEEKTKQLKEYIRLKERNVEKLNAIVKGLNKTISELREENLKLGAYNQATKDMVEMYTKNHFQLIVQASSQATQSQSQQQSQTISLPAYRDLISQINKVDDEIKKKPDEYSDIEKIDELKKLIKEIKTKDIDGFDSGFLTKIKESSVVKYFMKPENITKISKSLLKLFDMIRLTFRTPLVKNRFFRILPP